MILSCSANKQAGAELGQAQVKLDDMVVIVVDGVVKAMVEVELGNIPVFILPLDPTLAPNLQE